ncbi:MAG: UMP kinase, partial [Candidatus Harrisonbacteria bacterium CG10_big_fil_rev_8_21_14_0_10_38_8]
MNYQFPNRSVVIKLGGSIIHPEDINTPYIKEFKEFIEKNVEEKKKFVIVAGGGQLARKFQLASKEIKSELTQEEADWIGIHATRLNAQLLRTVLANITDPIVIHRRFKIKFRQYPVTISSGWTPGNSTDHIAAILAKDFKTKVFIVAGKPEYMYDK